MTTYTTATVSVIGLDDFKKVLKVIKSCDGKNYYHFQCCLNLQNNFNKLHDDEYLYNIISDMIKLKFKKVKKVKA